jgi:glyoxylase-like metal-dependent hydrolase (beta-lactamase superfamily II)
MKIGTWDVSILETGRFALDGGAMFGVVPKALWSRTNPADDRNRIAMAARTLLVRGNGRNILIDTGNGDKWDEKTRDIYAIGEFGLESALAAHGLTPNDVTDVLLTHLHFDHCGGSTRLVEGVPVPRFPNARYAVQKDNLAWGRKATEKDRASYLPENFEPLVSEGMLDLIDGEGEFAPGISLHLMHGHTVSMQVIRVHDEHNSIAFCADLIPTATHLHLPFIMAYDNHPLTTLEEKRAFIPRASEEGWIIVFEHDPVTPAARVARGPKGFALGEIITL